MICLKDELDYLYVVGFSEALVLEIVFYSVALCVFLGLDFELIYVGELVSYFHYFNHPTQIQLPGRLKPQLLHLLSISLTCKKAIPL